MVRLISDPVSATNGSVMEHMVEFTLFSFFPFSITRQLNSTISENGPLGHYFASSLDVWIEAKDDEHFPAGVLIYHDGNGFSIPFERPVPNIGLWSRNDRFPKVCIQAIERRGLLLRDDALFHTFRKYSDNVWRLLKTEDANETQIHYKRDAQGVLEEVEFSCGLTLEFFNSLDGRRLGYDIVNLSGERRPVMRYTYNATGNLVSAVNEVGVSRAYRYDENNAIIEWSDHQRTVGRYAYDESNRVIGLQTTGAYNGDAFIYEKDATIYRPGGNEACDIRFEYNEDEEVTAEYWPEGIVRRYEYSEEGHLIIEVDGEDNIKKYNYDGNGHLVSDEDAEGRLNFYNYSIVGNLCYFVDAQNNSWKFDYDELGNLVQVINPLGVITEIKNNERGQPVGIMRHDGLLEQRQYDDYGRLIGVSDFRGSATRLTYDGFGRVLTVTDAKGAITTLEYTPQKGVDFWQPSSITRPDGVVISRTFDQGRQTLKLFDGERREVTYHYGPFELLETIEDAKGGRLAFTYDGQERLESVTNQLGQVWTFERDAAGRVIKETDFSGLVQSYVYDKADRVIETHYADGARLTFAYDKSGLLLKEQAYGADGLLQDETRYDYDGAAQLMRAENNSAVVEFERDKLGRIISETANGREITSSYDCCGNRIAREIGGRLVESAYDPLGVLKSLTIGDHKPLVMTLDMLGRELKRESEAGFRLEQSYDIIGQLTGQTAGLSVASFGKGIEGAMATQKLGVDTQKLGAQVDRKYQWNKAFEPLEIGDKRWGGTSYAYDANGQIGEASFGDGSKERFRYDSAMNISGFSGDDVASRFEPWLAKQGGAITEAKGPNGERIELKYDIRNRVVERRVQRNGFRLKIWKYEWDAKDRLVATTAPEGERWTYGYDPFGRRIFKINAKAAKAAIQLQNKGQLTAEEQNRGAYYEEPKNHNYPTKDGQHIVGTSYLWDGNTIVEEADMLGDGSTDWDNATRWHYEPDSFRPIAKETPDGDLLYIVTDHLGTPREMFSEDGHLQWAAQYRTWGGIKHIFKPDNDNDKTALGYPPNGGGGGRSHGNLAVKYDTVEAQAAQDCPIRFQGQWEDAETGLYYNLFRYYDPLAGQYLSSDPIGLQGGTRPQGYVHNPATWVDPWGLASKKPGRATECCSVYASYEDARNSALKKLEDYGGIDPATRRPIYAEDFNGKNPAAGKEIGFEGRTFSGQPIKYYFDYDPIKGNHINLKVGKGNGMVVNEAFVFPGSQQDYLNMLKGIQN